MRRQRLLIDQRSACSIDKHGVLFHKTERSGVEHMERLRERRCVYGHYITRPEQFFKLHLFRTRFPYGVSTHERIVHNDIDKKIAHEFCVMPARPSETDHAHSQVIKLADIFLALVPASL